MKNLFIDEAEEIVINFTVAEAQDGTIYCGIDKEKFVKDLEEGCEINDYKAVFKKPNFGDTVNIYDFMFNVRDNASVNLNLNPVLARYNKIIALIKSWDLTDEKPTEQVIRKLHPIIANTIGIQLESLVGNVI